MNKKETLDNLGEFELVVPAQLILGTILNSPNFLKAKVIDEKRARELKLAVSAQNALVKAFHTKTGYFKLIGVTQKLKYFKKGRK